MGAHGTAQANVGSIRSDGALRLSSVGRRGKGVYLWKNGKRARDLAVGWARQSLKLKKNDPAALGRSAVVWGLVRCLRSQHIDLEQDQIREAIGELCSHLFGDDSAPTDEEVSGVYDRFIEDIERAQKRKLAVLEGNVPAPAQEYMSRYPREALSSPRTLVVRDAKVLKIIEIEPVV